MVREFLLKCLYLIALPSNISTALLHGNRHFVFTPGKTGLNDEDLLSAICSCSEVVDLLASCGCVR